MAAVNEPEREAWTEWMGRKWDQGLAEVGAYWRQGLRELRNLIYPESPHASLPDPGMWGNRLPQEIYNDRHGVHGKADDAPKKVETNQGADIKQHVQPGEMHSQEPNREMPTVEPPTSGVQPGSPNEPSIQNEMDRALASRDAEPRAEKELERE